MNEYICIHDVAGKRVDVTFKIRRVAEAFIASAMTRCIEFREVSYDWNSTISDFVEVRTTNLVIPKQIYLV